MFHIQQQLKKLFACVFQCVRCLVVMRTIQALRVSAVRPPSIGEVGKDVEDIEDYYLHHLQNDSLWLSN